MQYAAVTTYQTQDLSTEGRCFLLIWKLQAISSSFVVWEWWIWLLIQLFSALIGLADLFSISCLNLYYRRHHTPKCHRLRGFRKVMSAIKICIRSTFHTEMSTRFCRSVGLLGFMCVMCVWPEIFWNAK